MSLEIVVTSTPEVVDALSESVVVENTTEITLLEASNQGPTGTQGAQGSTGPQGEPGPQGIQGLAGSEGVQGPAGIQGDAGPQGVKGDAGVQGVQGDIGPQGLQGLQGIQGAVGDTGLQGIQGPAGSATSGTTLLDFGEGTDTASSVVMGQTLISGASSIDARVARGPTADNDSEAHQLASALMTVTISNVIDGTGFTITAITHDSECTGTFLVAWRWD